MGLCRIVLAAALAWSGIGYALPAAAASAALAAGAASVGSEAARLALPAMHRHRTQSFYCYPRNYWWFYRPYTTNSDGHARCMPYFHYLGRGPSGRAEPYIK
jgi:hypothetical protein